MKNYNEFLNESKNEEFIFYLEEKCDTCNGTGLDPNASCEPCEGIGLDTKWEYDEDLGAEVQHDIDCENCSGNGYTTDSCDYCSEEGSIEWSLTYKQHKGILEIGDNNANIDHPDQRKNGTIRFDEPSRYTKGLKNIIEHIFNHKNLSINDIVNSTVRYMIEMNYIEKYKIGEEMKDLLDDKTYNMMKSYNIVNKYNL